MKKVYNNPVVNVLALDAEDIITASLTNGKTQLEQDGDMVAKMTSFDFT